MSSLSNIGWWCFVLGIKNVHLDVNTGVITARDEYSRIVTNQATSVPSISQVVCLEGDTVSLRGRISLPGTEELQQVEWICKGSFPFVQFMARSAGFHPCHLVYALQNHWGTDEWEGNVRYERKLRSLKQGNLAWEAHVWDSRDRNRWCTAEWSAFWKSWDVGGSPSLFQTLSFIPYHSIWSGFPQKLLLRPFTEQVAIHIREWRESADTLLKPDMKLDNYLREDKFPFIRQNSLFYRVSMGTQLVHIIL
jgi:hypothetical protein